MLTQIFERKAKAAESDVPRATLPAVPRLWPGETAVVLGGGPSLTAADVDYCRGKARVIAIKESYYMAPWSDVLYGCDEKFWRGEQGAPTFHGLKYALEPGASGWPGVQVLRNTGKEGLELDPTGLRTGQNSGFQAIGIAVHLGVAKVLLLGFDMWRGPDGRQNWHEGMGIAKSHHLHSPYPVFLHFFDTIVEPLKQAGVEVVNCTPDSRLTCFPMVRLQDALP